MVVGVISSNARPEATPSRVAAALRLGGHADVRTIPWFGLDVRSDGLFVDGEAPSQPRRGQARSQRGAQDRGARDRVDALLFFPDPQPPAGGAGADEAVARARLACFGITPKCDSNAVAHRIVAAASRMGVATNAAGADAYLGRKDEMETVLRAYARATGQRVPRPQTHVVAGEQVPAVLGNFHSSGRAGIVKPARGARAEGTRVATAGDPVAAWPGDEDFVVQELIPDPLLVNGHKCDLRVYLTVCAEGRKRSYRLGPVYVRVAPVPYVHGSLEAEITNSALRCRLGLPMAIGPLNTVDGLSDATRRVIGDRLRELLADLQSAHEWWIGSMESWCPSPPGSRRVLIWGLDVAPHAAPELQLSLLEINVYPVLFCGPGDCERKTEQWLATDVLSLLSGARE